MPRKDITLYAKWIENFTVEFDSQGGTEIESQEITSGLTATEPDDPTKVGHTFAYWSTDVDGVNEFSFDTPITADTTLYAQYTVNNYTLTFDTNGGTEIAAKEVPYASLLSAFKPENPTRAGYRFVGWSYDEELDNGSGTAINWETDTMGSENITIYALQRLFRQSM